MLSLLDFAHQHVAAVDGGSALREYVFGFECGLAGSLECGAHFEGFALLLLNLLSEGFFFTFEFFNILAAHHDFLVEGLNGQDGIAALYSLLIIAGCHTRLVRLVVCLFALAHVAFGLGFAVHPCQTALDALHLVIGTLARRDEEVAPLLLLGQVFGFKAVAQDARELVFERLLRSPRLVCQLVDAL